MNILLMKMSGNKNRQRITLPMKMSGFKNMGGENVMGRLKKSVAGATLCAGVVFGCMAMAFPTSAADAASTSLQDIGTQKVSVQAKKMNKKELVQKGAEAAEGQL